jgi:hypothetical protein
MLQISPNARACRSLSSTCKLEGFDAYLTYTKQAAANNRKPALRKNLENYAYYAAF